MAVDVISTIDDELRRSAPAPVMDLAAQLALRGRGHTMAVLFYGSALRADALDGVLDFYVLLDRVGDWKGSRMAAVANHLLPPHVGYFAGEAAGETLRAKYAVMSLQQFRHGMSVKSFDTTLWARFSQPCICVWARSGNDRQQAAAAVEQALITAARWAALLGPECAAPSDFWRSLFARTYKTELRIESSGRANDIVDRDAQRYAGVLPAAWRASGIDFETVGDGRLRPRLSSAERRSAARRWARRQWLGRPLNMVRLMKAAFTFDGAMDYVAWKVQRHSGVRIEVSPWQRRFPLLAAPKLYWQLRKRGLLG